MTTRDRLARHSAFSDPGRHDRLLRELSGIEEICTAVSNVVLHYRAEAHLVSDDRRGENNSAGSRLFWTLIRHGIPAHCWIHGRLAYRRYGRIEST
jgi:hypothetical protein